MDKEKLKTNCKREYRGDDFTIPETKRFKKEETARNKMSLKKTRKNLNEPLPNVFTDNNQSPMPHSYTELLNLFVSMDVAVNKLIFNRQTIQIDNISKLTKQMNIGDFSTDSFRQILTIFPESYRFEIDQLSSDKSKRLTISPNLKFGLRNDVSPRKSERSLSLSQLIMRRRTMEERLMAIVKAAHDEHLVKVKGLRVEDVRSMNVLRWSEDFDVRALPPIETRVSLETACAALCSEAAEAVKADRDSKVAEKSPRALRQAQLCLWDTQRPSPRTPTPVERRSVHERRQSLPFHLRALADVFVAVDKAVYSMLARAEMAGLAAVLKAASDASRTFTVTHFRQVLTIYPHAYRLRWAQLPRRPSSSGSQYDVILAPDLRHDGTSVSLQSPDKGYIRMDVQRLKQRTDECLRLCETVVEARRRSFDVEGAVFNPEVHVPLVAPADLPARPVHAGADSETAGTNKLASVKALFTAFKERRNTAKGEGKACEEAPAVTSVPEKLRGLPEGLLARVRLNKAKGVLTGYRDLSLARRRVLARLPSLLRSLTVHEHQAGPQAPIALDTVLATNRMTLEELEAHVAVLNEVVPGAVRVLKWAQPSLQMGASVPTVRALQERVAFLLAPLQPPQ